METRYLSQPGVGAASRVAPGQFVTPAPRSYKSARHAQIAFPQGRVYVCELDETADALHVVAKVEYPLTLAETPVVGRGASAEGCYVLRDLGPDATHRYVTHFRNDQMGGYHDGGYFQNLDTAVADYGAHVTRALARLAAMAAQPA